ncbi:MAG: hypothetical protein M1825_002605 [Sarcosagium campestre]|nr:MAG: hypothetical protein M1825_002605 [Sarcosagium campestre]
MPLTVSRVYPPEDQPLSTPLPTSRRPPTQRPVSDFSASNGGTGLALLSYAQQQRLSSRNVTWDLIDVLRNTGPEAKVRPCDKTPRRATSIVPKRPVSGLSRLNLFQRKLGRSDPSAREESTGSSIGGTPYQQIVVDGPAPYIEKSAMAYPDSVPQAYTAPPLPSLSRYGEASARENTTSSRGSSQHSSKDFDLRDSEVSAETPATEIFEEDIMSKLPQRHRGKVAQAAQEPADNVGSRIPVSTEARRPLTRLFISEDDGPTSRKSHASPAVTRSSQNSRSSNYSLPLRDYVHSTPQAPANGTDGCEVSQSQSEEATASSRVGTTVRQSGAMSSRIASMEARAGRLSLQELSRPDASAGGNASQARPAPLRLPAAIEENASEDVQPPMPGPAPTKALPMLPDNVHTRTRSGSGTKTNSRPSSRRSSTRKRQSLGESRDRGLPSPAMGGSRPPQLASIDASGSDLPPDVLKLTRKGREERVRARKMRDLQSLRARHENRKLDETLDGRPHDNITSNKDVSRTARHSGLSHASSSSSCSSPISPRALQFRSSMRLSRHDALSSLKGSPKRMPRYENTLSPIILVTEQDPRAGRATNAEEIPPTPHLQSSEQARPETSLEETAPAHALCDENLPHSAPATQSSFKETDIEARIVAMERRNELLEAALIAVLRAPVANSKLASAGAAPNTASGQRDGPTLESLLPGIGQ